MRTRRRLLSTLARLLTAWVLLMVQGVCDTAHFAAAAFAPSPSTIACAATASADSEARHAALCHCRTCRGPKHCCCETAASDAQQHAFRAVCDTPDETGIPGGIGPMRALPPATVTLVHRQERAIPVYLAHRFPAPYTLRPEPLTPPPSV